MGRIGSNRAQKEFAKLYDSICGKYSRYEVWQDFVWMAATAMANTVDQLHAPAREKRYMTIIKKYSKETQSVFPQLFALVVTGMEEEPDQDFLGELYMELGLGNSQAGQFFTPYDVCKMMAQCTIRPDELQAELEKKHYVSVNDPACGAGATLVAAAMVLKG